MRDVVVVGAGIVGLATAYRLLEARGVTIGAVTGVQGISWTELVIEGVFVDVPLVIDDR